MMVDGHIIEDTSDAVNLVDLISQTMFGGGVGEGNPPEDAGAGFSFGFGSSDDSFTDGAEGNFGEDVSDGSDAGADSETSAQ